VSQKFVRTTPNSERLVSLNLVYVSEQKDCSDPSHVIHGNIEYSLLSGFLNEHAHTSVSLNLYDSLSVGGAGAIKQHTIFVISNQVG
jgi:hypothetical protein